MIRYNNSGATIRIMAIFVIKLRNTKSIESNNNDSNYYHVRWPFFFFFFFLQKRVPSSSWRRNHWLKSGADPFFLVSLSLLPLGPYIFLYPCSSLLVSFFSFSLAFVLVHAFTPSIFATEHHARTRQLFGTEMWPR